MTTILDRRAPLAALRTAVFGFSTGTALGGLFAAASAPGAAAGDVSD